MGLVHNQKRKGMSIRFVTAFTLGVVSWLTGVASAQERPLPPRAQEAPPPLVVRTDGTTVLTGEAIPKYIVVQNFFLLAYLHGRTESRWTSFLGRIGLEADSESAAALRRISNEVFASIDKGQHPDEQRTKVEQFAEDVAQARGLGRAWNELLTTLFDLGQSTQELELFVEEVVRKDTTFAVSPESLDVLHLTLPQAQQDFEAAAGAGADQ